MCLLFLGVTLHTTRALTRSFRRSPTAASVARVTESGAWSTPIAIIAICVMHVPLTQCNRFDVPRLRSRAGIFSVPCAVRGIPATLCFTCSHLQLFFAFCRVQFGNGDEAINHPLDATCLSARSLPLPSFFPKA